MRVQLVFLLACFLQLQVAAFGTSEKTNGSEPELKLVLEENYELFKRQHIAKGMVATACTSEMKRRDINNKSCKEKHTFIAEEEEDVVAVCRDKGEYMSENHLTRSERDFRIIVCKHMKKAKKGPCQYTGQQRTARIVMKCKTLPVHYEEDVATFEG
ncbi:PREDICTED: angiogenin-like [Poecilia mexicana]|uniref:angiogenin-like n=1 Tax=Poecilia mexicana TaxID=48701 RepID=UPI00072E2471|nr:PREDICTED: angiogenin-like [Poecilia mexicana]